MERKNLMAQITLKGNTVNTAGDLPEIGASAPEFSVVKQDFTTASLSDFKGKKIVLNIFPSLDTSVCAASVRKFNAEANGLQNTVVLCISRDLPFAHKRFCAAEGLENVITGSEFRDTGFSRSYKIVMTDGPLQGLFSRAVVVIDEKGKVFYTEQVPEISQEPDYEKALAAVKSA
jgi:thiol peroxidase